VGTQEKQSLLELLNPYERLQRLHDLLDVEVEKVNIDKRINVNVKKQMEKAQKEYYLNEKVKAIHQELGRKDDRGDEIAELREKIEKANLPKEAAEKADQELKRLEAMPPVSAEATVSRNYIDWLVRVPWKKKSRELKDLDRAQEILDEDHYGLEEIKERILEFLAVRQMSSESQSSVICFVGPPGVGKSSFAKSIARAMGREFVRFSLGGVRDEAEIRGHRRTYIGARPGRLVRALSDAGTMNPVILLDEIDKVGSDWRGDPSSALLEVLDPAQNSTFRDHYLETDLDLSEVVFIATANVLDTIPAPLLDRMEIISLEGYTEDEKIAIARDHLLPRLYERNGISPDEIVISEAIVRTVVGEYTRESGVRRLEQRLDRLIRRGVSELVRNPDQSTISIGEDDLRPALGRTAVRDLPEERVIDPGIATGLAVTGAGGDVLFVEVSASDGDPGLTLTGQLGDVMRESGQIVLSYLRANAQEHGIDDEALAQRFHVHFPAGAVPKDGPSAGVTMTTAFLSLLRDQAMRSDVAMTGEVTLHGRVLPIGGVKEKVLAAHRAGVRHVILPEGNREDAEDIPVNVLDSIELHFAATVDDVIEVAFAPPQDPDAE